MSDKMDKVRRFRRTETAIRAMDPTDIVEIVHALEDERDALRAALDAAEKDNTNLSQQALALLSERDAAQAALERSEKAGQNYLQERDMAMHERDAALVATWRRAVAAAAEWLEDRGEQVSIGTAAEFSYCVSRIRALQPPADLAAQAAAAPGDALARAITPDTHAVVPVEASDAMADASLDRDAWNDGDTIYHGIYCAMIAAARKESEHD